MDFSFFNRPALKKITVSAANPLAEAARVAVDGILHELPDLLMTYIADVASGTVLAAYTSHRSYNPNQISLRNARVFSLMDDTSTAHPWLGGPVLDLTKRECPWLRTLTWLISTSKPLPPTTPKW